MFREAAGRAMLKQEHREHQQAAGEDDRHDAGLVDAQRQELARAAVDAPAANVLGGLRRDAALPLGDGDDGDDDRDEQERQQQQFFDARLRCRE